ncbi:MAG: alanine racemase [Candidatus Dormibacteria bacterium]
MIEGSATRWAEIDLSAIRDNVRLLRGRLPAETLLGVVVKADAYGHGALAVAPEAIAAGAEWLMVATVGEALQLRGAGLDASILNMGPSTVDDATAAASGEISICAYSHATIETAAAGARIAGRRLRVHLKVDSGMARLGAMPDEVLELARVIDADPRLDLEGLWTHFSDADIEGSARTRAQLEIFLSARAEIEAAGLCPRLYHCGNSAATLLSSETHFDLVRCGLPVYGYLPMAALKPGLERLRPALTWKARVVATRQLRPGDRVGYGGTYTPARPTVLATVSVGYADGYSRALSNRGTALVGGVRVPVVGRVSMDFVNLDLGPSPAVAVGDEAVLLGRQGDEAVDAAEIAALLDTIPYEVLCNIGSRVPRIYTNATQG